MITQDYLKECFSYNSETGILVWKKRPLHHFKDGRAQKIFNTKYSLKAAGCIDKGIRKTPYLITSINNKSYRLHRIIWKLVTGKDADQIDHPNGNGLDNRLCNLRDVSITENNRNMSLGTLNKTGVLGIYWDKRRKQWRAEIKFNKKNIHIGYYGDKFDAICARKSKEYSLGFHENHGRS